MGYLEDYAADGFIDIGDKGEATDERLEEMVKVEEALHERKKVRVRGLCLDFFCI